MRVRALYFAALRERAGTGEDVLELPPGATVAQALEAVGALRPGLRALDASVRVAVDRAFSSLDQPLQDGSELALLPPVSGG